MKTTNASMNLQIERLETPTREHFYEHYVKKNKPVILTGVTKDWPAMSKWNPEYLKSVAGDAEVTVHFNDQGNFHEWYTNHDRRIDRKISLRELVDKLAGEPADKRYYMTEHNLDLISDQLVEDVDFSKYQIDLDFPLKPCLFMGSDTCMPMHFHAVTEALLCQIYTRKKIWLYSPDQSSLLYMRPWYGTSPVFSQVDCRNPDFDRFPKFRKAVPLEFVLEPGEILFIPIHWWHLTKAEGFQVNVTQFWRAEKGCWRYPLPGIPVLLNEWTKGIRRLVKARA